MGEKVEKKVDGEKKSGDGPITVVLKTDLHCEGCAKKIQRSVKHFEGVEKVRVDVTNNKITVTGNIEPEKLREGVESKTKKKVELVSPQPKKDDKKADVKPPEKKVEEKVEKQKPKEVSTVVLKIRLHCDGCIHKMKRIIKKFNGVDNVIADSKNDLVTVKGTMDVQKLVPYLKVKLKRDVEIIAPKKDDGGGGGDKKEKVGDNKKEGGGDKKKGGDGGDKKENVSDQKKESGGDKKENVGDKKEKVVGDKKEDGGNKKEGGSEGEKKEKGGDGEKKKEASKVEVNKLEHHGYDPYNTFIMPPYNNHGMTSTIMYNQKYYNQDYGVTVYDQGHANYNYGVGYFHAPPPPPPPALYHAPQMFSDENPNACSVM